MRAIKLISALTSGNKEQLENIKSGILNQHTAVGGIFLAINGGLVLALRSITRLAGFLTQVAVTNLLIRPIQLIFKIARNIATAIAAGMSIGGAPPIVNNTRNIKNNKNVRNTNNPFNVPGIKTNAAITLGFTIADIATGEDPGRAIAGGGTAFASYLFLDRIGAFLSRQRNARISAFGFGLRGVSGILGNVLGNPLCKRGFDAVQQAFGLG